jgi:hypothetical protein
MRNASKSNGDELMSAKHTSVARVPSLMMSKVGQLRVACGDVLRHRAFYETVLGLVIIACITYLLWEPLTEYIFAGMRLHFWGYPV